MKRFRFRVLDIAVRTCRVTHLVLFREVEGDALVSRVQKHKGPVRGLDFNIFKPNLLASGATESEV